MRAFLKGVLLGIFCLNACADRPHIIFILADDMGGRDLVDPWVHACRNNDIKVGLYYSMKGR